MNTAEDLSHYFEGSDLSSLVEIEPSYYSDRSMLLQEKYRDLGLPDSELQTVRQRIDNGEPWRGVIHSFTTQKKSSWLERIILSPARSLFLDLIDFENINTVLDLGAGYGQLTVPLSKLAHRILSVEPTRERLDITYAICEQEGIENVDFILSDFFNLNLCLGAVDLAILCGVYEWLGKGRTEEVGTIQQEALEKLHRVVSPGGQLAIAIETESA